MHDVLEELCFLSKALQSRDINVVLAERKVPQAIRAISCMTEKAGEQLDIAVKAVKSRNFKGVTLRDMKTCKIMSIVNYMTHRL